MLRWRWSLGSLLPLVFVAELLGDVLSDVGTTEIVKTRIDGVFAAVREAFRITGGRQLLSDIKRVYDFRNTRIAHQEDPLDDPGLAEKELRHWMETLCALASV